MYTNADCTIYHRVYDANSHQENYVRTVLYGVFWENKKGINVIKSGMEKADQATIYIPFSVGPFELKPGDRIVHGAVDLDVTGGRISEVEETYPDVLTVTSIDRMDYGRPEMRHWEVGGR